MALSDYEKKVLAEMEAQLKEADPSLASTMNSSLPDLPQPVEVGKFSPRRIAMGSILAVVGLAVVVTGVSFGFGVWAVVGGVAGFAMMVGGVLLALKTDPSGKTRPVADSATMDPKDFMSRQHDRWDSRDR